jgi:phage-related protein
MTWTVDFYAEGDGSAPVEAFLAQLPLEHRAKALAIVRLLEEMGPGLPFPYSSQVKGKIRELRTQQGKDKIRILYFADDRRRFILLHGFIKRTDRLSKSEMETAQQRMERHNRRLERRPRA